MQKDLAAEAAAGNRGALARLLYDNYDIVFKYLIKFTMSRSLARSLFRKPW